MKKIKVNRKLLQGLRDLRMNCICRSTTTTPTVHYDYELITLVLKNNGAI